MRFAAHHDLFAHKHSRAGPVVYSYIFVIFFIFIVMKFCVSVSEDAWAGFSIRRDVRCGNVCVCVYFQCQVKNGWSVAFAWKPKNWSPPAAKWAQKSHTVCSCRNIFFSKQQPFLFFIGFIISYKYIYVVFFLLCSILRVFFSSSVFRLVGRFFRSRGDQNEYTLGRVPWIMKWHFSVWADGTILSHLLGCRQCLYILIIPIIWANNNIWLIYIYVIYIRGIQQNTHYMYIYTPSYCMKLNGCLFVIRHHWLPFFDKSARLRFMTWGSVIRLLGSLLHNFGSYSFLFFFC